jgi:hypothetical protein
MVQEKKSSAKRLLDGIMGGASARSDTGVQPDGEEGGFVDSPAPPGTDAPAHAQGGKEDQLRLQNER